MKRFTRPLLIDEYLGTHEMTEIFHEIQAAHFLGFQTAAAFLAARKRGDVPPPRRYIGRRPIWTREQLEAWITDRSERMTVEALYDEIESM